MLELVLKTKWYDMIDSGEKLEEYRDISDFWCVRIFKEPFTNNMEHKHDKVRFSLGYAKNRKQMIFEIDRVSIGSANPKWVDNNGAFYIIHLGKRIS